MTHRFDPAQLDRYLKHSARLRSCAFMETLGSVRNGLQDTVRAVVTLLA